MTPKETESKKKEIKMIIENKQNKEGLSKPSPTTQEH